MIFSTRIVQNRSFFLPWSYKKKSLYTLALTRSVPDSFVNAISSSPKDSKNAISVPEARIQHDVYEGNLRTLTYTLTIPAAEDYPDCPFVEDTVVAIGKSAVVNRIGAKSRVGEADEIEKLLVNMGLDVTDMRKVSDTATCDGGDVLYPGGKRKDMFVGMFGRTNEEGVDILQQKFRDLNVIPIPDVDGSGTLHLKSIVTHMDENTLVVPKDDLADEIILAMGAEEKGYNIVKVPDKRICNLVSVNGVILASTTDCVESQNILNQAASERNIEIRYLNMNEFAKADGSLTCLSVLLNLD